MKVSGLNDFFQISFESNSKNAVNKLPLVWPPLDNPLKISELQSYSTYYSHSIKVNNDGKAFVVGSNGRKALFKGLPKKMIEWTPINIDESEFISVVCGNCYALCLLKPNENIKLPHLYCFWNELYEGIQIFIDIEDRVPIGLFGGRKIAAAIDSHGDVIIISPSVFSKADHKADIISLPNNEKSTYVACLEKSVLILSEKNKVYEYILGNQDSYVKEVRELNDKEIISLSGTYRHALAVSSKNEVFGRGLNECGQLCIDSKLTPSLNTFMQITNLNDKNIVSASAGSYHSLFTDSEGKIYSCGQNQKGELLSDTMKPSRKLVEYPLETAIASKAKYCIAGCQLSCAFVSTDLPPNTPNQRITKFDEIEQKRDYIHKKDELGSISESHIQLSTLNPKINTKYPSKPSFSTSEPAKLKIFRQQIRNNARNRSKYYNIEKLEEIQEVRSQISSMRKQSQEISMQISELQKEKNTMMHNLYQIGKIIEQIKALRNGSEIISEPAYDDNDKSNSNVNLGIKHKNNRNQNNETKGHQIQVSKPTKNNWSGPNSNDRKNEILIQFKDNKQPSKNINKLSDIAKETNKTPQKALNAQIESKQPKKDIQIVLPQNKITENLNEKQSANTKLNINKNGVLVTRNDQSNKVQVVKNSQSEKPQSYSYYNKPIIQKDNAPVSSKPSIFIEKKSSNNIFLKPSVQVVKKQKSDLKIDIKKKDSKDQNDNAENDKNIINDSGIIMESDDDDDDDDYDENNEEDDFDDN